MSEPQPPNPHSITHATMLVDPKAAAKKDNQNAVKNMASGLGAQFQKMRRRLTVTGASETIDGVSKLSVSEPSEKEQTYQSSIRCAVKEYSGISKKGHAPYNPRKKNQDALIMAHDPATQSLVLCVLDGHGEHGDMVSAAFRDQLTSELFNHTAWATDMCKACSDAIAKIEHGVIRNFRIDTEFSGTTLSMAIVRGNTLLGVNIGDSRVILSANGRAVEITHDHKPDSPVEKERILACGGRVFAVEYDDGVDGPPRVWLGHMDVPGLAMSRSLGDAVAHTAGVISDPEFTHYDLSPDKDHFIVVATDGLWEFVDNAETIKFVESASSPQEAVEILIKESSLRWMREEQVIDDTTIIVANLFHYHQSNDKDANQDMASGDE